MKRTWPYINTPLVAFGIVMCPICGFMCLLLILPQQNWIRTSAALVLGFSFYAFLRGYVRRLRIDPDGVRFFTLAGGHFIAWNDIQRIERYVPTGAVNGPRYIYVTKLDRPPAGLAEQDSRTFQLQDRPGLLETLQQAWKSAQMREVQR